MAYSTDTTGNAATADKLKTARTINGVSFDGSANIDVVTAGTVGPGYYAPGYVSGTYYFTNCYTSSGTSASLGNNQVRVTPWIVTASVTITRLFAEFTAAGDANSVYRIGIWNHDSSTGKPSTLLLDAGSISTGSGNAGTVSTGGTPGVYEITVSQAITPGVYWVGGAVQGAATTQPTMRIGAASTIPTFLPISTTLPTGTAFVGFTLGSQTGAFGSLSAAIAAGTAGARIGFKTA